MKITLVTTLLAYSVALGLVRCGPVRENAINGAHRATSTPPILGPICESAGNISSWSSYFGVLRAGATAYIPCGKTIIFDRDAQVTRIGLLKIDGTLNIPETSPETTIEVSNILIQGNLHIGRERNHIRKRFVFKIVPSGQKLTLRRGGNSFDWNTKAVVVAGGRVKMHGMPGGSGCISKSWARLRKPTVVGATYIILDVNVAGCWQVGHEIGIAPSYTSNKEREVRKISRISGYAVFFDEPLKYAHTGNSDNFNAGGKNIRYTTEVGLLTRNIAFEGVLTGLEGFHFIIANTERRQVIHGVEFVRGGQQGVMGRYPLHFHMCNQNQKSRVRGCSVHQSVQRGIIIHGTDRVTVERNVLFDFVGHGIGFEDGVERENVIQDNLMINGPRASKFFSVDGRQESDGLPSCVWMRGPSNYIVGNVAVGCHFGFWFELTSSVRGPSKYLPQAIDMNPQKMPVTRFHGNTAHSGMTGVSLYPDGMFPAQKNVFSDLQLYFLAERGIFVHNSNMILVENVTVSDTNMVGIDLDRIMDTELRNSVVIGRSPLANKCPDGYGVELHPIRGLSNRFTPTTINNVVFDKFQGCPMAPLSVGNELDTFQGTFNRQQSLPASTKLTDVEFMDNPDMTVFLPQKRSDIPNSMDSDWTSHVTIRVEDSPTISTKDGFLISSNNAALRPPARECVSQKGKRSLFCTGVCYRTLRLQFKGSGERDPLPWKLKLTRLSDGAVDYLKHPTWGSNVGGERMYDFFGNLVGGEQYLLTPMVPKGGTLVQFFAIRYDDGATPACTDGVDIVISERMNSFIIGSNHEPGYQRPCPGAATSVKSEDVTFYSRCDANRGPEFVIQLPFMFNMPESSLYLLAGKGPAPNCRSGTISRCRAFEPRSAWKMFDGGRDPGDFASPSFNDLTWITATGIFGYNNDKATATVITTETTREHPTVYFRKEFTVSNPACYQNFSGNPRILYDDGFVMYVNGVEVLRENIPDGPPSYYTYAITGGGTANGYADLRSDLMKSLKTGKNVVAVEVHMGEQMKVLTAAQKDLRFEMYLDLMYAPSPGC